MSYRALLVIFVQVTMNCAAPLLVMPIPWPGESTQQYMLQKQLMELQALRQVAVQSPLPINNQPQLVLILLPTEELTPNINPTEHLKLHKDNDDKSAIHTNLENEDDLNSIVIEAASEKNQNENQAILPQYPQPQRTILLIPNGRLSIGEIVSAIPWLPIEINVPDTISWAYNGIASGIGSIISIIGRPFQGMQQDAQVQDANLKGLLREIQTRQNMVRPIIMIPIDGPVLPIQV